MPDSIAEQVKNIRQEALASAEDSTVPTDDDVTQPGQGSAPAEKPVYLRQVTDEEWASASEPQRASLMKIGKSLYDDYQGKMKDLSSERKIRAALEEDAGLAEVIKAYQDGNLKPPSQAKAMSAVSSQKTVSEAEDLIDELKRSEDPLVRERATMLERAIERRLSSVIPENLQDELKNLKAIVASVRGAQVDSHQDQISRKLDSLSEAWTPVLDKYREKLLVKAAANPNISFEHLLMITLEKAEYDAAVIADHAIQSKKQVNKAKKDIQTVATPKAGSENTEPKKNTGRFGQRTDFKTAIANMLPEIKAKAPQA